MCTNIWMWNVGTKNVDAKESGLVKWRKQNRGVENQMWGRTGLDDTGKIVLERKWGLGGNSMDIRIRRSVSSTSGLLYTLRGIPNHILVRLIGSRK